MPNIFQTGFAFSGNDITPIQAADFIGDNLTMSGTGTSDALVYTPFCYITNGSGAFVDTTTGDKWLTKDFTANPVDDAYYRVYIYLDAYPTGPMRIARFRSGTGNYIASLYVNGNGHYFIASGNGSTSLWTSTVDYKDQWARLEWHVSSPRSGTAGNQRLRLYRDTNIFADDQTVNFETSPISAVTSFAGGVQSFAFGGVNTVEVGKYTMDALVVQDDGWAGPIIPAPLAAFVTSAPAGVTPLNVNFTNRSFNASSFVWNFGDGSPSVADTNPSHVYTRSGNFFVDLKAISPDGVTFDRAQQEIVVTPAAVAGTTVFDLSYESGVIGQPYTNSSLTYKDGGASVLVNGVRPVKGTNSLLFDGSNGGTAVYNYKFPAAVPQIFHRNYLTIPSKPNSPMVLANAKYNGAVVARVTYDEHGLFTLWRGSDGALGDKVAESNGGVSDGIPLRLEWFVHPYPDAPGDQVLRLYIGSNMHGPDANLTISTVVAPNAGIDEFEFGIEQTCGGKVRMDQTALGSQDWLLATDAGNAFTGSPVPGFVASPLLIMKGDKVKFDNYSLVSPTSYSWNFGDGTGAGTNPKHTYSAGGTYNVTMKATNAAGTSANASLVVTVLDPARGRVDPKVFHNGAFHAEAATGGLVKVRTGGVWRRSQPRVLKGGLWSSNDVRGGGGGSTGGWGAGTASLGTWYGSSIDQASDAQTAYNDAIAAFTNLDVVRAFSSGWVGDWSNVTQKAKVGTPNVVWYSTKLRHPPAGTTATPTNSDWVVLSGTDTAAKDALQLRFYNLAKSVPENQKIWMTAHHEPENDVGVPLFQGYFTQSAWKDAQKMFQAAVTQVRSERLTNKNNIKYLPILMGWTTDPRSGRNTDAWTVAGMDAWGWDPYEIGEAQGVRDYSIAHGMDWAIGEWGNNTTDDVTMRNWMLSYWIAAVNDAAVKPRAMCYWQASNGWNAILDPNDPLKPMPKSAALWASICTTGLPPPALWP